MNDNTPPPMKMPATVEANKKKIASVKKNLKNFRAKKDLKDGTKEIALGTSKTNYMDPRITIAWAKRKEVPIEKMFTKALRSKFLWAMGVEMEWNF